MYRSGIMIAAALTVASPRIASATAYDFSAVETSALSASPETFSFSLDTATAGASSGGASFSNVTITENGRPIVGNTLTASFTTNLASPLFFFVDTSPSTVPFYTGTGSGIVFNTGSFAIAEGLTEGEGTLTIAAASDSAVPEPATWAVLLAGLALMAAGRGIYRAMWNTGSHDAAAA